MSTTFKSAVTQQFKSPHGALGWLAGQIMAHRPSNRLRNAWTIELMDLQPGQRVLEIGFGPGLALAQVAKDIAPGRAVGIDHSPAMFAQAARRCWRAKEEGRVALHLIGVESLDANSGNILGAPFDRIFAVNNALFWPDLVDGLIRLRALLSAEGGIFITHQPRTGALTDTAASKAAQRISQAMLDAGFEATTIHELKAVAPMAVCIEGRVAP